MELANAKATIMAGCAIGAGLSLIAGIGPVSVKVMQLVRLVKPSAVSPNAKAP